MAGGAVTGRLGEEDCNDDTTPATTVAMVAGSNCEDVDVGVAIRHQSKPRDSLLLDDTCTGDEGRSEKNAHAVGD